VLATRREAETGTSSEVHHGSLWGLNCLNGDVFEVEVTENHEKIVMKILYQIFNFLSSGSRVRKFSIPFRDGLSRGILEKEIPHQCVRVNFCNYVECSIANNSVNPILESAGG
jgi:hypothetical protein